MMGKIRRSRAGKRQKRKKSGTGNQALLQRAMEWHRQGAFAEAQEAYRKFLKQHPRHADALGNYGLLLHRQNDVEQAVFLYEQAVALNPGLSHLFYHLGTGLLVLGQPEQAVVACTKALDRGHAPVETLLCLGKAHIEAANLPEAKRCFADLLRFEPHNIDALYQAGLVAFVLKQFEEAVDFFSSALSLQEDNTDICFNLALCYKALCQYDAALELLRQAERLSPADGDILYNIGVLHKIQGNEKEAETVFLRVLDLAPDHGMCLTDLAILYHKQNRLKEAGAAYEQALASGYCSGSARHMLSALGGVTTGSAPLEHIQDLFNNFADTFDQSLLDDLQYTVPSQLADILRVYRSEGVCSSGVDLGCGTGLSGLSFQGLCEHITGVDLAENMLTKAEERGVYDTLCCTDILHFLGSAEQQFDLVIAADVFVYLGELDSFFAAVISVLRPNGYLLFSVETCDTGYCLRSSGRYAHSPDYISVLADRYQFSITHMRKTGIRWERGEWIAGELYMLSLKLT